LPPLAAETALPPATGEPKKEPEKPKALAVGKDGNGSFQMSSLLQFWLVASRQDVLPPADKTSLNFRVRRGEFRLKGDIVPERVQYQLMVDAARALEPNQVDAAAPGGTGTVRAAGVANAFTLLQDFFVTFPTPIVDISVGQYKTPLGYEGYNSSARTLFPERAPIERHYGDRRDIGLRLEKKLGDYVMYSAGLFNGSGQNKMDEDQAKDGALRLEIYPFEGLTLAGVGYATLGKRKRITRDRLEADLRFEKYDATVLISHIRGFDRRNQAKAVRGHGSYAQAGYTLFGHLQPMVRAGEVEPDIDTGGDHYRHFEGGLAWLFQKNEAKITLAVAHYAPTHPDKVKVVKKTEGILAVQAGF
jgi:hypothetical protein